MKPKVDYSIYNNDWYKRQVGASRLKQGLWFFTNILFLMNPLNPFSSLRIFWLRRFGARIGKGVVMRPANIKYPWKLEVGNHCWIGENVWIDNLETVKMGDNVCISQGAMLLTGNHLYSTPSFDLVVKGIQLEDGVWIGAKAVVCPGVTCKTHAVLAVMSVANKNLEPYTIYQGNPAVSIRVRVIE